MKMFEPSRRWVVCWLGGVILTGCGNNHAAATGSSLPSSTGANGWATVYTDGSATVTQGGALADLAHTYHVADRSAFLKALYPDVVIAADGSFTSAAGADPTPKIIYVQGSIDLSVDGNLQPLGYAEFKTADYDVQSYINAYQPRVWNIDPANWDAANMRPTRPAGPLEMARSASANRQRAVVRVAFASNTSLLGVGADAKLLHGNLVLGTGVENVVIRNITFEDAFDHFTGWDPTDSFSFDPSTPGCQVAYDAATDSGPQQCPGGRWNSNYDSISVTGGLHVWIDHCTFSDGARDDSMFPSVFPPPHAGHEYEVQHHDGTVDVTGPSDFVTLSFNHFQNHDKTNLLGGSDTVTVANGWGALSVTLHHNYYENTIQRMPRVRMGKVHVYDNYVKGTVAAAGEGGYIYGIGVGYLAKVYSENNVFEITGPDPIDERYMVRNFYKAAPATGDALDVGQQTYFFDAGSMLNGMPRDMFAADSAAAVGEGRPALLDTRTVWQPSASYAYTPEAAAAVKDRVVREAGAGHL